MRGPVNSDVDTPPVCGNGNFYLLLKLAGGEDGGDRSDLSPQEDVVRLAARHRVRSLLGGYGCIGTAISSALYRWSVENARNHALLKRVARTLDDGGVDFVLIKGAAICAVNGEQDSRDYDDVDILIRPESYKGAAVLMADLGLHTSHPLTDNIVDNLARSGGHLGFRGENGECVELSSRGLLPYFARVPLNAFFEGSVVKQIEGMGIRCAGRIEAMVHLCAHGCEHNWTRLRWVLDVVYMIDNLSLDDCHASANAAKRWGLARCLDVSVSLIGVLGLPLARDKALALCSRGCSGGIVRRLAQEAESVLECNEGRFYLPRRRMLRYQLLCRERLRDRIMMLCRLLLQPSRDDIIRSDSHPWICRSMFSVRIFGLIHRRLIYSRIRS